MRSLDRDFIVGHNDKLSAYYMEKASWCRSHPTELEKQMKEFLGNHHIRYQFKRIFNVKNRKGLIEQSHIVDFFIPNSNTIITLGFKSYSWEDSYNDKRFAWLKKRCPKLNFVHWSKNDFNSYQNMKSLLAVIENKKGKH